MNKTFFYSSSFCLLLFSIFFAGCAKKDIHCEARKVVVPPNEMIDLANYLENHQLVAEKDNRGFYFRILEEGIEKQPTACSEVTVNYSGKLTNGQIFDQNQNSTFNLSGLIAGWQMGLPLIKEGGTIELYLPPSLGYGIQGNAGIPSNAITIFSISLIKVLK